MAEINKIELRGAYKCIPYVVLAPGIALMLILNYYPIAQALFRSFFLWRGGEKATFVGLENFRELMADPAFKISMIHLLKLLSIRLVFIIFIPLFVAELIFELSYHKHLRRFFRVLYILPVVIPTIVILLIWQFIYDGSIGLLNNALKSLGFSYLTRDWLGSPETSLYAIAFISFPWVHPYLCALILLTCLAALQNVDREIFDVCKIDGAGGLIRFFKIDLGLILDQMKVMLILAIIMLIQDFIGILILTNGGPGYATMVPGVYLYQNAFYYARMGYACAIGIVIFGLVFTLTIIVRMLQAR